MTDTNDQLALSAALTLKTNQLCIGLESGTAEIFELVTPERAFIAWAQADTLVEAFCKLSENRHTFTRLRYVKDDGLPAFYSPDFLVRTKDAVYLVETKAQQQTIHPNVQRKLRAALAWCDRINDLSVFDRGSPPWHYMLLAENVLAELLDFARLRPLASASQQERLI